MVYGSMVKKEAIILTSEMNIEHDLTVPADLIRSAKSKALNGYTVIVGITGSIASVEMVKIIRELIRHGADVYAVMSNASEKIVTRNAIQFATGNPVVTELTGNVEHVSMLFNKKKVIYVVAPATANTISKIACGIDDTAPTSFATIALGAGIKMIIAPAMHGQMYRNPIILDHIKKLKKLNVDFIFPLHEENEAKLASMQQILDYVIKATYKGMLKRKKILIIGGSTREEIDDVRYISNQSSGYTAISLAREAFYNGAEVSLFYGMGNLVELNFDNIKRFKNINELKKLINENGKWDVIIVPAALSDFTIEKRTGKISSEEDLILKLKKTDKILPILRKKSEIVIGFKMEWGLKEENLINKAVKKIEEYGIDMIIANNLDKISYSETEAYIVHKNKKYEKFKGTKEQLSSAIFKHIIDIIKQKYI